MTNPNAIFDKDSLWNIRREQLEQTSLASAEMLIDHSGADKLTLRGNGFELSVKRVPTQGPHQ